MNKIIFICWLQGFDNAPVVVKKSLISWKINNPTWEIKEITYNNIKKYVNIEEDIPNVYNKNMKLAHLSDIIRVHLLDKYGGLWCDATTICTKPLDEWLVEYINSGFFAFKWKLKNVVKSGRILSNWFLYSNKNNYIIQKWKYKINNYWNTNNKAKNYFVHHHLFNKLYKNDQKFKKMFNDTKDYDCLDGPYYCRFGKDKKQLHQEPIKNIKYN